LEILRFGDLEIWRFGDLEIWRFGDLEIDMEIFTASLRDFRYQVLICENHPSRGGMKISIPFSSPWLLVLTC
jgi:hypothetical protein